MILYHRKWLEKLNYFLSEETNNPNLDNAQIAAALEISESTLHRRLVEITEKTPLKYVRSHRLKKAQDLLLTGKYATVKAIAHEVGFLKVAYFSQQYEKAFGKRPLDRLRKNTDRNEDLLLNITI